MAWLRRYSGFSLKGVSLWDGVAASLVVYLFTLIWLWMAWLRRYSCFSLRGCFTLGWRGLGCFLKNKPRPPTVSHRSSKLVLFFIFSSIALASLYPLCRNGCSALLYFQ